MGIVSTLLTDLRFNVGGDADSGRPVDVSSSRTENGWEYAAEVKASVSASAIQLGQVGVGNKFVYALSIRNIGTTNVLVDMRSCLGGEPNVVRMRPGGKLIFWDAPQMEIAGDSNTNGTNFQGWYVGTEGTDLGTVLISYLQGEEP